MDTIIAIIIAVVLTLLFVRGYLKSLKKRDEEARKAAEKGKLYSSGPQAQHPHIDTNWCIGCATCTLVCPEGDVLAMLGGRPASLKGLKRTGTTPAAESAPL